jgi:hypothetical protein
MISNAARSTTNTTNTADITATQPANVQQNAPVQKAVPTQKPAPVHVPKWTTTHTFSGSGSKKTGTFTAPGDWRIAWSCNPTSFSGYAFNLIILVYGPDGNLVDSGVNTMCQRGNVSDVDEVHVGGQVYLDITSEGDWTIQVQELK